MHQLTATKEKDQLYSTSYLELKRNITLMPKTRNLTVEERSSVVTLRGEGNARKSKLGSTMLHGSHGTYARR